MKKHILEKSRNPIPSLTLVLIFAIQFQTVLLSQQINTTYPDTVKKVLQYNSADLNYKSGSTKWYGMFTNIPTDYLSFIRQSFTVKKIPTLLTIGALTGSLMLVDQQGWKTENSMIKKSLIDHKIANFAVNMGDGRYQFLTAAAFAIPGLIFHDQRAIKTGSNIVEAILSTGLFVQALKRITGRQSPAASTENGGDWDPFPSIRQYQKNQPAFYSFPSGHLSTATAVLTVIANNYPEEKWIKPIGYPLLGLLSLSLVSKGMHWYSDLPLAFFLGYSFGNIIAPEKDSASQDNRKSSLKIFPSITFNGVQLGINYRF